VARRIVEVVTSDLSGEEVPEGDLRLVSFTWQDVEYELDAGTSEEPESFTVKDLLAVARPATEADLTPVSSLPVTSAAKAPAQATASRQPTPAAKKAPGKAGPVPGAPRFTPQEYFDVFGADLNGQQVFKCPVCSSTWDAPELTNATVGRFRAHVDNVHGKLLWALTAKARNLPIPAGYADRA
jgi:hypothetical protein